MTRVIGHNVALSFSNAFVGVPKKLLDSISKAGLRTDSELMKKMSMCLQTHHDGCKLDLS